MGKRNKLIGTIQVGNVYGELTVEAIGKRQVGKRIRPVAYCRHSDGSKKCVRADHLAVGATRGIKSSTGRNGLTQVHRGSHSSWQHMLDRCYNDKHPHFRYYGGRGIVVCDRWKESFTAFLEDMGDRPNGLTLDRIDTDKGYEPGNCRWATYQEQNRNKTNGTRLTFNGETLSVTNWAERLGVDRATLFSRIQLGWSVEDTLTKPIRLRRWAKKPIS